jgi:hypothetical protein
MKTAALAIAAALALGGSASAAERAQKIPQPHCEAIDAMKASAKDAKFTVLTPGQTHFLQGFYVASPITPPGGMPPGDGAILIEKHDYTGVIWTSGKQACVTEIVFDVEHHMAAYMPLPIDPKLRAMLDAVKTGTYEKVTPDEDRSL